MRLGVRAALVDGAVVAGDVVVEDGVVTAVGAEPTGIRGLAAPGFVDLHINGFVGVDFLAADAAGYVAAGAALAATGVVAFRPTFITSPVDALRAALETVAGLPPADGPEVLGVHLEGPFLSPRWPGAHDPAHLLDVDPVLAEGLLASGPVTAMTLAPELDGGLALVAQLAERGVAVSLGHTDADAVTARAAYDAGARAVTHLHNAQRRWSARDPGVAGVALVHPGVVVQLIADGVHLAPETILAAFATAGDRACLVTDAVEAAGCAPGAYRLGGQDVEVDGSAVRRPDGRLAGSLLTMDEAVRCAVASGVEPVAALRAAAEVPARLAGRPDLGSLRVGSPANLVVLDDELHVRRTLVRGREVAAA